MPDIIDVSDLLEAVVTRVARAYEREISETVLISDEVSRSKLDIKWIPQFVLGVNDSVERVVQAREPQNNIRTISESITISETVQAYKNDELLIPPAAPVLPEVPNLIGTRERAVRAVRRAPRPIVIDEIKNVAIAPLKLLAFSDSNNKAIVGIRPRPVKNAALSRLILARSPLMIAESRIKIQPEPMIVKAALGLPLSSLNLTTAKLKLRPQVQTMHALKAVNFERMHKLTRIMKIAMLIENL